MFFLNFMLLLQYSWLLRHSHITKLLYFVIFLLSIAVTEQKRKAYQLALRDGKANFSNFRLLVFGPENSGKTCLVSTLFNEPFQHNPATQGADVNIGTVYATNWCKCSLLKKWPTNLMSSFGII